jgi:formylglycine-generating enzyme required for sulfatase activity
MKKTIKLIAIVASIAFSMASLTSCGDGAGGGGSNTTGGNTPGGSNDPKAGDLWTNKTGVAFSWVPGGTFTMGSPSTEPGRYPDEGPQLTVALTGFYMGKYQVTRAQYQTVMGSNPSYFTDTVSKGRQEWKKPLK